MLLLIPVVALLGLVVGIVFGWKWVLAPLLGVGLWLWLSTTLRSFASPPEHAGGGPARGDGPDPGGAHPGGAQPGAGDPDERIMYWCEQCGTELLLVLRGSGAAPRHCGTRMHERAEIPSARHDA